MGWMLRAMERIVVMVRKTLLSLPWERLRNLRGMGSEGPVRGSSTGRNTRQYMTVDARSAVLRDRSQPRTDGVQICVASQ